MADAGFPSGYFKIRSRHNNKCLDINGGSIKAGSRVVVYKCNEGMHQQWYADGMGRIINRLSGLALEANTDINGATVRIDQPSSESRQLWTVDVQGKIISKQNHKLLTFDENNANDILPVYIWEAYKTASQRWYFDIVGMEKSSVQLVVSRDMIQGSLVIPNYRLVSSDEYTLSYWFVLNKFKAGNWGHIVHKGDANATQTRTMGMWLDSKEPKFHVRISTTYNSDEGCNPDYKVPLGKWIHLAYVVKGKTLTFYVDGRSEAQCQLQGFPNSNQEDLRIFQNPPNSGWIDPSNRDYSIKSLEYANYALSQSEIERLIANSPMAVGNIFPEGKLPQYGDPSGEEEDKGLPIPVLRYRSDASYPEVYCAPIKGALNSDSAWCAASTKAKSWDGNYLQLDFDGTYDVKTVSIRGRISHTQWTTKYGLQYFDAQGQWVNYDTMEGSKDSGTITTTKIHFTTNSVRVIPFEWHDHPSLRVGFSGTKAEGVSQPQIDIPIPVVTYSSDDSYPTGDKTEPICAPDKAALDSDSAWCAANSKSKEWDSNYLQLDFDGVYEVHKVKTKGRVPHSQWTTKYGLQFLDANGKWVNYATMTGNKDTSTVVASDVKFVTKSVRVIPFEWHEHASIRVGFEGVSSQYGSGSRRGQRGGASAPKLEENVRQKQCLPRALSPPEIQEMQTFEECQVDLRKCQSRFKQQGGGVYARICKKLPAEHPYVEGYDKYDIRNHLDFEDLMNNYISRQECQEQQKPWLPNWWSPQESEESPKYREETGNRKQGQQEQEYQPKQGRHQEQEYRQKQQPKGEQEYQPKQEMFQNGEEQLVIPANAGEYVKNYISLLQDIKQHPQYDSYMHKDEVRDLMNKAKQQPDRKQQSDPKRCNGFF